MKFGIIIFPGSNCDMDCFYVLDSIIRVDVKYIWHKDKNPDKVDCIILPGGFSYGDYLRAGAIASFSPVRDFILKHNEEKKPILGICNGFQILLELGLLNGALIKNKNLKFICKDIYLKCITNETPFTSLMEKNAVYKMPIAHEQGCFYTNNQPNIENQIAFKYVNQNGEINEESNPNGSCNNIAGITNENKNILGLMPHPERASAEFLGNKDGLLIFKSIIHYYG
jgi:phosphoribosylformylglycinamidine synthase